ncbi:MAG TPA: hypothetical protein VHP33_36300 [Polyangiaceae bacterium]|nr:hypothetical protein [Polyangiaceae bacterium]
MRSSVPTYTLALACGLAALACGSQPAGQKPATPASVTLSCPSLDARRVDFAQLFGIDSQMSARLERTLRLASALQRSANELEQQASATCQSFVSDVGGRVEAGEHPCIALSRRAEEIKQTLGSGGFQVRVSGLSCAVPVDALASCAGECLTGQVGVVSAVSCVTEPGGSCGLDFALPNASRECAAECAVSSLPRALCTAQVDVKLGTGETTPPELMAMADALRKGLPRLLGLAGSLAPRGAAIANTSVQLVDELAASIDELSSGGAKLDRRAVTGLVLGGCVAPKLAEVVRDSSRLQTALGAATRAQAAFGPL